MRIWFKQFKDAHLIKDATIDNYQDDTRTHKIFQALEEACNTFDISVPIWLDSNVQEFQNRSKTRFGRDNFIEDLPFDFLEIEILEEDY